MNWRLFSPTRIFLNSVLEQLLHRLQFIILNMLSFLVVSRLCRFFRRFLCFGVEFWGSAREKPFDGVAFPKGIINWMMHVTPIFLNPEQVLHDGVFSFPRLIKVRAGVLAFRVGEGTDFSHRAFLAVVELYI